MAQATASLGPIITLSKFYARKRVIADARAAGIRWQELDYAEISLAAREYLSSHPELIARATEALRQLDARDRQRREMARRRRAQISSGAQLRKA